MELIQGLLLYYIRNDRSMSIENEHGLKKKLQARSSSSSRFMVKASNYMFMHFSSPPCIIIPSFPSKKRFGCPLFFPFGTLHRGMDGFRVRKQPQSTLLSLEIKSFPPKQLHFPFPSYIMERYCPMWAVLFAYSI